LEGVCEEDEALNFLVLLLLLEMRSMSCALSLRAVGSIVVLVLVLVLVLLVVLLATGVEVFPCTEEDSMGCWGRSQTFFFDGIVAAAAVAVAGAVEAAAAGLAEAEAGVLVDLTAVLPLLPTVTPPAGALATAVERGFFSSVLVLGFVLVVVVAGLAAFRLVDGCSGIFLVFAGDNADAVFVLVLG